MTDSQLHWKAFGEVELTHSNAHYLMAIAELLEANGYARAIDVSRHLDLTRGSVSAALTSLEEKGYITTDQNKFLQLTDQGIDAVNNVFSARRILTQFFSEVLGVNEDLAEEDACKIEHLVSHETGEKLMSFLGFYLSESPVAREFREEFTRFAYTCDAADNCHICENRCYFHG